MIRKSLVRYAAVFFAVLVCTAWIRGWIGAPELPAPDPLPLVVNHGSGSAPGKLPVVYTDKELLTANRTPSNAKIPKIIHQTWKSYTIPKKFVPLVRTWRVINPDFEYWFWTDADAAKFIEKNYPQHLQFFKSLPQNIMRADAMRYFILYHYGGWYADMDIEALRPLKDFDGKHHCIISQEPWAHTKIFWNKNRLACNALMAARPRHPFFAMLINELPKKRGSKNDVMSRTGPKFMDSTVALYEKNYKNYDDDSISMYLADPDTFLPTLAGNAMQLLKKRCSVKQNSVEKQKICDRYKAMGFHDQAPKSAYTNHVWVHTYYGINEKQGEDIFSLVPEAKNVKNMLEGKAETSSNSEIKVDSQGRIVKVGDKGHLGRGF